MLMQHTLTQFKTLKLDGMTRAFEEQSALTASTSLSFEERIGMLVDREFAWRDTRRLERLLRAAKLKNPQACVAGSRMQGIPSGRLFPLLLGM